MAGLVVALVLAGVGVALYFYFRKKKEEPQAPKKNQIPEVEESYLGFLSQMKTVFRTQDKEFQESFIKNNQDKIKLYMNDWDFAAQFNEIINEYGR